MFFNIQLNDQAASVDYKMGEFPRNLIDKENDIFIKLDFE